MRPTQPQPNQAGDVLALFVQQVEQCGRLPADQVDAAAVVDVVDVVPTDALRPVLLLKIEEHTHRRTHTDEHTHTRPLSSEAWLSSEGTAVRPGAGKKRNALV